MGQLRVTLRLAWRNLWRNYRRTLIMLAAVTVGAWAMIFMTALMRGMVDEMVADGISALPGHVQIHHPSFRDDPSVANLMPSPGERLRHALDDPEVVAWATRVRVPAVISSEREKSFFFQVLLSTNLILDFSPCKAGFEMTYAKVSFPLVPSRLAGQWRKRESYGIINALLGDSRSGRE